MRCVVRFRGFSIVKWERAFAGWYFEDLSGGDVCVDFGAVNVWLLGV